MKHPIKHCYWVSPGQLLAGEYPIDKDAESSIQKINALIQAGVTAFIDLTRENDGLRLYSGMLDGISYQRFPIRDVSIPDSVQVTKGILDTIDHHINQGKTVYLHCWGGVGRTGTIVGCWLARHGQEGAAALNRLQELWKQCPKSSRRNAPDTEEQKQYILSWKEPEINPLMRFQGCLVGLAVGDALGTTVETLAPGTFLPVKDMVGGGPFGLKPGEWTDETSLALCLAESLVTCKGFDAKDQMNRYLRWWKEGCLSDNGKHFIIETTTSQSLKRYLNTGNAMDGNTGNRGVGTGCLTRLAPVSLFYANEPYVAIAMSGASSLTTHAAVQSIDACRYFGGLIVGAINGVSKEELLSSRYSPVKGLWHWQPLYGEIDKVACGSFKHKEPFEIGGRGYVVHSLEAALWAFYKSSTFKEGCLLAVNLGYDADTTAAIYGQIAGAYYGIEGIPHAWRERLASRDRIDGVAKELFDYSRINSQSASEGRRLKTDKRKSSLARLNVDQIIDTYSGENLVLSKSYMDGGVDPLWPRFERAAINQINAGPATIARYAIWANTVRDNIREGINCIENSRVEEAKKSLIRAANSLSAFTDVQAYFDPFGIGDKH